MREIIHLLSKDETELVKKVLQRPTPFYVKITDPVKKIKLKSGAYLRELNSMEVHGACFIYYETDDIRTPLKMKLPEILTKEGIDTSLKQYSNDDICNIIDIYREYYAREYRPAIELAVYKLNKEIDACEKKIRSLKSLIGTSLKEGTWNLHSEIDPRWNCSGRSLCGKFIMPDACREKQRELEQSFGDPPDDLSWGYVKD